MRGAKRKHVAGGIRMALCLAALWLVARGLSIDDTLVLRDGTILVGTVSDYKDRVSCEAGGVVHTVPRTDVAVTDRGAERIAYGLKSVWRHSTKRMLLYGVIVFLLVPPMQAMRLRWLLAALRIRMGWWESVRLAFAGNFLNFAAPLGSTAGDVFKAYYVALHTPRKTEAAATVFIDRVIGLATLLVSVALIAAMSAPQSRLAPLRTYLLGLVALLVLGGLLYVLPFVRGWSATQALTRRLPQREQLQRIDATARELLSRKSMLLGSVLVTLVLQAFAAGAFLCVGLALGLRLGAASPLDTYAHFSAGEIIKAMPGPPQGLGTMELAYGYFFAGLGSASQIVSTAVAIRLVNLVCALPGLVLLAVGACGARRAAEPARAGAASPATAIAAV